MNPAKIQFSEEESALLQQADWLLTKNRIISAIYDLMGVWSQELQQQETTLRNRLPGAVFTASGKISRGESYQGLPWVMLDHPRYFTRDEVFALRSFFWWGRSWCITLHLKGKYASILYNLAASQLDTLAREGFSLGYEGEEWDHDWINNNSLPFSGLTKKELLQRVQQAPFIKIGKRISLDHWQNWYTEIARIQQLLLDLVPDQFPNR